LFRIDRSRARYIRVTMLKNSANPGMHIAEIQAFDWLPQEVEKP